MIKVNDFVITEKEFDLACNDLRNRIKAPTLKKEYIEGIVEQLIDARLIIEESKMKGISVEDEEVESVYKKILNNFTDEKEFLKLLESNGDSIESLKEKIKEDLILKSFIDNLANSIEVKDEDVISYYNDNIDSFKQSNVVKASHILFDNKDLELAIQVKKEIDDGESFEDKAKEYSKCPSKEKGGDLGYFTKGKMVKEFEEACFKSPLGIVTEPIKTQFGYHLIKVYDKKSELVEPFDNVKDGLKNHLKNTLINYNLSKISSELKKEAKIDIDKEKLEEKIKFWEDFGK